MIFVDVVPERGRKRSLPNSLPHIATCSLTFDLAGRALRMATKRVSVLVDLVRRNINLVRLLSNHTERRTVMLPYRSASNFGTSDDPIEGTINSLAKDLQRLNVDYAIAGGNALKVHGFKRFTTDVDVLLAKGGKKKFAENLVGRGYAPRFEKARSKFKHTSFNVDIDLLESGDFPGDGKPKEVAFPDPKESSFELVNSSGVIVNYLQLSSMIELKLASYQSLPNEREKDKLDVIELVKVTKN